MYGGYAVIGFLGLSFLYLIYKPSFHLVALIVLFLISLLNVVKAPTSKLWLLAILTSEYSILFAGLTSLLFLPSFYIGFLTLPEVAIGLVALLLFLYPIITAYFIAQNLATALEKAFQPNKKATIIRDKKCVSQSFCIGKLFKTVPKVSFRTLTYVTYDDAILTLDYYKSTVTGRRPCVIIIHGGAWRRGDSKQLPELNSHLARAGYHCAAINYRLAPRWKCPAPIKDVTAAINYLCKHADDLDIDTNNFVLLGRSAGAQIALLTAYTLQRSCIKGIIDFYGPADMIYGYMVPSNPFVINSQEVLTSFIGGDYYQMPDKYVASSPIEFVNRQSVPTLIFHGLTDSLVFLEHSRRLSTKLQQNDVSHYLLELPWATHGFDYHLNGPGGQLSTFSIEYFLRVVTDGQ